MIRLTTAKLSDVFNALAVASAAVEFIINQPEKIVENDHRARAAYRSIQRAVKDLREAMNLPSEAEMAKAKVIGHEGAVRE